jgi:hypothetical protein
LGRFGGLNKIESIDVVFYGNTSPSKVGTNFICGYIQLNGLGFFYGFFHLLGFSLEGSMADNAKKSYPIAIYTFIAGFLCWPRGQRTIKRMVFAGIMTVASSFLFLGLGFWLSQIWTSAEMQISFLTVPFILIYGSVVTLFIPYFIGVELSLLFTDKQMTEANELN